MSVARYTKKPVTIEAMRYRGPEDDDTLRTFAGHWVSVGPSVYVTTPEGAVTVTPGSWVLKGVQGEFYPCLDAIFQATYTPEAPPATTAAELYTQADALEQEVRFLRKQAGELRFAELQAKKKADRLVYAPTSRCPCGLGLAYDPVQEDRGSPFVGALSGYWDCSGVLLGTADVTVKHTDRLPFAFYEVKAEGQPSANGATTRPQKEGA